MCGIGGIWNLDRSRADHGALRRMMTAIRHRGPEGAAFGRMNHGSLLLGFLRLGFTDGGTCQQPLYNEDYRVGLVFNGEIYDHVVLGNELRAKGHTLRTASDSEVIVHLYEEHGPQLFERLNGEFAFAIWDARRDELLLARDRFGVKPLFYAWHHGAFVFASEAKAILALDGFAAAFDAAYFAGPGVGLVGSAVTPFRGIRAVRPGHSLRVSRKRTCETPYWTPRFGTSSRATAPPTMADAAGEVRRTLERSVARRMEGDPPISVSLSSGVDSTIVCGLVAAQARANGRALTAFSVGYPGEPYDESAAAARTAKHFGVGFERVVCSPETLADEFLSTIRSIEVPTNSLSAVARIQLAAAVRSSGNKALMSGEGSDELFGGYPYFGLEAIWRMRRSPDRATQQRGDRAWERFRREEASSRGIFWDDSSEWQKAPFGFGYPSAYELRARRVRRSARHLFSADWLARIEAATQDGGPASDLDPSVLRSLAPFDATRLVAREVLASLIIPGLGDRVEMARGIEGRTPYLDLDVVQCAYSLPESLCVDPTTFRRKHVLRNAFADLLPPAFCPPAKTTRMAPSFADMARTRRGNDVLETLLADRAVRHAGVFDPRFVAGLKSLWRFWPVRGRTQASLDLLLGYVACTQALHATLVEGVHASRPSDSLALDEDRSPPAASCDRPAEHWVAATAPTSPRSASFAEEGVS